MKREIEEFRPERVAVDSLSALERVAPVKSFREFVIGLISFIKHLEIPGLFTSTTSSLLGGDSITETHISTITDSIILLRYVEMHGEMRRGLTVLKMRGSLHDKEIREFTIDSRGHAHRRPVPRGRRASSRATSAAIAITDAVAATAAAAATVEATTRTTMRSAAMGHAGRRRRPYTERADGSRRHRTRRSSAA